MRISISKDQIDYEKIAREAAVDLGFDLYVNDLFSIDNKGLEILYMN